MSDPLKDIAQWLVYDVGYPHDVWFDRCPPGLWEAVIDVVHEDRDGRMHGNELTREEVASWLADGV